MNKKQQDKIVSEVKGVLPTVLEFMEKNPHIADFDYGYLYGVGTWECTFFNEDDDAIMYLTASTDEQLIDKIKFYM